MLPLGRCSPLLAESAPIVSRPIPTVVIGRGPPPPMRRPEHAAPLLPRQTAILQYPPQPSHGSTSGAHQATHRTPSVSIVLRSSARGLHTARERRDHFTGRVRAEVDLERLRTRRHAEGFDGPTGASAPARATAVSARKVPLGTSFHFTLSAVAKLQITISRSTPGLCKGRACRAPSAKLARAHAKRCTRSLPVGTLTRASEVRGADSISFSGRIGRRALSPGPTRPPSARPTPRGDPSR